MSTAPARTVTAEDADKARKAVADLERIERLVTSVLVILGFGGLIFTAVNVTLFAIDHHTSPGIAWMLDPLVSLALLGVLFIDGRLAAHGYKPNGWPFLLRWFAGLSTWLMNCWASLYPHGFTGWPDNPDPAGLVLHSVIPFLVILLAEAGAGYRKFSTGKKREHKNLLDAFRDQAEAKRQADAEAKRRREEQQRAEAEAERRRAAELKDAEQRAETEARKARELAEAKARELEAASAAEARRAEQARLDAEARRRAEAQEREQQARLAREDAEHAAALERQRILAEAEADAAKAQAAAAAEAERLRAEADVRAREERRRSKEARRMPTAEPTAELTAVPSGATAETATATAELTAETTAVLPRPTAETTAEVTAEPRKLTAVPTAETDEVRGAEAKRKQIEDANFEAAVLIRMDIAPTRKDFAAQYGRSETWGRDRYTDAERLMSEDPAFAARVTAEADNRNSILTSA